MSESSDAAAGPADQTGAGGSTVPGAAATPLSPASTPSPSASPRMVGGRYRLGPLIGRGGMATIHRATDTRLDRDVAIKLLRAEVSADPDLAQRFRREALAATVLRHPNIVACLDTGTDGEQPYLVMDLVEGEDLAARLRRGGRLAPPQAARIGLDVARGLGVAHVRGIVHRDIKPGNILLASDGRAMVADFGIARLTMDAEAAQPGTTLGSVYYFSPEQARGATTTPASDVYSLGLVLYETLTGQRAWTGDSTDAIALARVGAEPPAPRAVRPEVPPQLDAVVVRALAPEAADRYPNGAAMAAALEPIVAALTPLAVPDMAVARTADAANAPAAVTAVTAATATDTATDPGPGPAPAVAAGSSITAAAAPVAPPLTPPGARPVATAASPRPATSVAQPRPAAIGRPSRTGPSALVAALVVVGVVGGALAVAALPGAGEAARASGAPSSTALAVVPTEPTTPASDAPPSTAATPVASKDPTPDPTPTPAIARTDPDLCETFFDLPCGLDAGRYAPTRFSPAIDFEIGDGWSTATHRPDVVTLTREEGILTFASGLTEVYPNESVVTPRPRARDAIEAFIATRGVGSTRPAGVRIDRRRGLSVDLAPLDDRVVLFATPSVTYYLETGRTTRLVALNLGRDRMLIIAIEPSGDFTLDELLDTADDVAASLDTRPS